MKIFSSKAMKQENSLNPIPNNCPHHPQNLLRAKKINKKKHDDDQSMMAGDIFNLN
jgi:hypothetical protein